MKENTSVEQYRLKTHEAMFSVHGILSNDKIIYIYIIYIYTFVNIYIYTHNRM